MASRFGHNPEGRMKQRVLLGATVLIVAAMLTMPQVILGGIDYFNGAAASKTTTALRPTNAAVDADKHQYGLSVRDVATATYVATNLSGSQIKLDLFWLCGSLYNPGNLSGTNGYDSTSKCAGLLTDTKDSAGMPAIKVELKAIDAAYLSCGNATLPCTPVNDTAIESDTLKKGYSSAADITTNLGLYRRNATDLGKARYLELTFKNYTSKFLLDNVATKVQYSLNPRDSGSYNNTGGADLKNIHTDTGKDFSMTVCWETGSACVVQTPSTSITDKGKDWQAPSDNVTNFEPLTFYELATADLDGKELTGRDDYDNRLVVRLHGYSIGSGNYINHCCDATSSAGGTWSKDGGAGLAGGENRPTNDTIEFSVAFLAPDTPGKTSYTTGFQLGLALYTGLFFVLALIVTPEITLGHFTGRRGGLP